MFGMNFLTEVLWVTSSIIIVKCCCLRRDQLARVEGNKEKSGKAFYDPWGSVTVGVACTVVSFKLTNVQLVMENE